MNRLPEADIIEGLLTVVDVQIGNTERQLLLENDLAAAHCVKRFKSGQVLPTAEDREVDIASLQRQLGNRVLVNHQKCCFLELGRSKEVIFVGDHDRLGARLPAVKNERSGSDRTGFVVFF